MSKSARKIYQFKITLSDTSPPIWRRFQVVDDILLPEFHVALQLIMGWKGQHSYEFVVKNRRYGVIYPEFDYLHVIDNQFVRLNQLLKREKQSIGYDYDLGDYWSHCLLLEKILPCEGDARVPVCIKAKGACPPENVGGVMGYYDFLEAIDDPKHPEHKKYCDWANGDFDPSAHDILATNEVLRKYFR